MEKEKQPLLQPEIEHPGDPALPSSSLPQIIELGPPEKRKTFTQNAVDCFKSSWAYLVVCGSVFFFALIVLVALGHNPVVILVPVDPQNLPSTATTQSEFFIAESIPEGVNETIHTEFTTADAWVSLINEATHSIDVACYYMTLRFGDPEGTAVYNALARALQRGVKVRIVQNVPSASQPADDTDALAKLGASVRSADFSFTGGILHTKFLIFDHVHLYVGSANMDWRSLSQVKELGAVVKNNALLALDLERIFLLYWSIGRNATVPAGGWDRTFDTHLNLTHPATITHLPGAGKDPVSSSVYFSSAPEACRTPQRTGDGDALIDLLDTAPKGSVVGISVMDYSPTFLYVKPRAYWDRIDSAIRRAAFERQVQVRFLVAHWNHTKAEMWPFLAALNDFDNVTIKWFVVPELPYRTIPYTRVNHAKFMVSVTKAFISTSNWSADYFVTTAGVSLNTDDKHTIARLQAIHERDWTSPFAKDFKDIPRPPPRR